MATKEDYKIFRKEMRLGELESLFEKYKKKGYKPYLKGSKGTVKIGFEK